MILFAHKSRNAAALTFAFLLSLVSTPLFAAQLAVTNVYDSGPGSLRQALLDLHAPSVCPRPCTVIFNMEKPSKTGYWTIEPLSPLPLVGPPFQIAIDATTQTMYGGDTNPYGPEIILSGASAGMTAGLRVLGPASGPGVVNADIAIRGFGFQNWQWAAVSISGAFGLYLQPIRLSGIAIVENYFGLDALGRSPAPNATAIVMGLVADAVIANNVISGNDQGISVGASPRVQIVKNNIGMDAMRTRTIGNAAVGVRFLNGVEESVVERNLIAGHKVAVTVEGMSSQGNAIYRNQMFDNGFGIDLQSDGPTPNDTTDLDSGPNDLQNRPVLRLSSGVLRGELDSTPRSDFDIDIYETDSPASNQGRRYLGTVVVTTDGSGLAGFSFMVPVGSGPYYTATATGDSNRSTSEFSDPVS